MHPSEHAKIVIAPTTKPRLSFDLASRNVHVWSTPTFASAHVSSWLESLLSPDEKERAAGFRFDHLRLSFVVVRGILRALLGGYLGISPTRLTLAYTAKGKPILREPANLHFNASHSGDLAVFAFTAACEVGVDVEQIRPLPDLQEIGRRIFSPGEAAELSGLSAEQREHAFFLCWTRKEAYLKATGGGLSAPLNSFRVSIRPEQPARFIELPYDASTWTLHDLPLTPNYAAALAYNDSERSVSISTLNDPADLLNIS
jgi:4'-phosphopantetheinyl transferase